jgi:hypothetical protein
VGQPTDREFYLSVMLSQESESHFFYVDNDGADNFPAVDKFYNSTCIHPSLLTTCRQNVNSGRFNKNFKNIKLLMGITRVLL